MQLKSIDNMNLTIQEIYTSVACNRTPEIADWNNEGIICYGATNAVVIYNTNLKGTNPIKVLSHHKSKVNSVKWLRKPDGSCTELLSCSADKTAAIWRNVDGIWKVTSVLTGHTDGVGCVNGLYTKDDDLLVFTGSIDSTIRVWERKDGTTNHKQTISLNSGLCLTLCPHLLGGQPVLFCALDDHKIHVFAGEEFHKVHSLVGHEDWVRGLDVMDFDSNTILLASASQDTYIRLWRIQLHVEQPTVGIKVEQKVFQACGTEWAVKLEAVLAGHEGWVYGVQWHPSVNTDGTITPVHRLLSSSLDKTLIVWAPDETGAWVERVRVGEVGGNGLGFYGSRFGPGGGSFLGHGYNGSFHIWELNKETRQWEPRVVCGGHFGRVEDIAWAPAKYLISVSADQTTRLHAPWTRPDGLAEWHELARPQVHGYDLAAIAPISSRTFASAAEEKVIRVFDAPSNFAHNYQAIVGQPLGGEDAGAEGASVPSLGLSNKAVFAGDVADDDGYFVPVKLTEPPTEETLMQNTLWPERHKLYGHGYEVFALAAAPDGGLLASACKANVAEHAALRLWDTQNWQQIQTLVSHQLTVTQLSFSPDSQHLLSVSRDRRWTLYSRQQGSNSFEQVACTDKTNGVHTRIIWCCAWTHDSKMFGTGSREGKVCLWTKSAPTSTSLGSHALASTLELPKESVTALAFAPVIHNLAAVGLDSGVIKFYTFGKEWTLLKELDHSAAHHLTVRRLAFKQDENALLLGSGGADHIVRVYGVSVS